MSVRKTTRSKASVQTIDDCRITETPDTQTDPSSLIQLINLAVAAQFCHNRVQLARFDSTRTDAAQVLMPLYHSSSSRRSPEPIRGERREQRRKMVFSRPLRALSEMRRPRIVLDLQPSRNPGSPIKLFFRIIPNSIPNQTHALITLVHTRQPGANTLPRYDNPHRKRVHVRYLTLVQSSRLFRLSKYSILIISHTKSSCF